MLLSRNWNPLLSVFPLITVLLIEGRLCLHGSFQGVNEQLQEQLHKENLEFEFVELKQRSYK